MGETALMEWAKSQGIYCLVLVMLAIAHVKYWVIPKAAADVKKTETDAVANTQQAAAMKTIATAFDSFVEEQRTHRQEIRKVARLTAAAVEACSKNDTAGMQSTVQALRTLLEES